MAAPGQAAGPAAVLDALPPLPPPLLEERRAGYARAGPLAALCATRHVGGSKDDEDLVIKERGTAAGDCTIVLQKLGGPSKR